MPLIPVLESQRQAEFCEFQDNLGYIGSFMPAWGYTMRLQTNKQKSVVSLFIVYLCPLNESFMLETLFTSLYMFK